MDPVYRLVEISVVKAVKETTWSFKVSFGPDVSNVIIIAVYLELTHVCLSQTSKLSWIPRVQVFLMMVVQVPPIEIPVSYHPPKPLSLPKDRSHSALVTFGNPRRSSLCSIQPFQPIILPTLLWCWYLDDYEEMYGGLYTKRRFCWRSLWREGGFIWWVVNGGEQG